MSIVLAFGTFDGIHDGHRAMLRQAKSLGGRLLVAIAPDSVVLTIKGDRLNHPAAHRIALVKAERIADEVLLADDETNSWRIIKKVKPDIVALGYDQDELRISLEAFLESVYPDIETESGEWIKNPKKPRIVILSAYKPDELHNSKLL